MVSISPRGNELLFTYIFISSLWFRKARRLVLSPQYALLRKLGGKWRTKSLNAKKNVETGMNKVFQKFKNIQVTFQK